MTCPRPQKSLGQSRTRNRVSTSSEMLLFRVTAPYATRWGLLCGPHHPERSPAAQPRSCGPGQDKAKRVGPDGSRISPGSGAQPLRPAWRRRWPVPAWRSGWSSGRVLRGRPCLTRAERTKRSGPVCARGSSRGGSGGPGAWLWPLMISRSWSSESAVPHRAPPAAASPARICG